MNKLKKSEVIIIGAGRNANLLTCVLEKNNIKIKAILDDNPKDRVLDYIVNSIDTYPLENSSLIISIASPKIRHEMDVRLSNKNIDWYCYIDPLAFTHHHITVGEGSFIAPFAFCSNAKIGKHCMILPHVGLGSGVEIGDYSLISHGATIASETTIGSGCTIGMGARISAGLKIGNNCRISSNTVVRRNMPDGTLAVQKSKTIIF
ncbi:DapH/DapD/GlmU-related protein [Marinomonas shanghaiensis]|uniref:DapH/DapD/GlmU-related protein n=1 Tax=Marinomonas shanghaiensis TaxID=2202418 RepID=UPI003A8CACD3